MTGKIRRNPLFAEIVFAFCATGLGCSQGAPRIVAPSIDASAVAEGVISQCDKNGDGVLNKEELSGCPAILASIAKYDANKDNNVSAEEITARINGWSKSGVGITTQTFFVLMDGKPLANARVQLIPEPYFEDVLFPAESGVNAAGMCTPSIAPANLPDGVPVGVYCGLYRVEVTHPDKKIPSRYNDQSLLGIEVCPDYDVYNPLKFQLRSK